jgi:hypothetical protein
MDWSWGGLGVPDEIVKSAQAHAGAALSEYLVFRYGVAEELWGRDYSDSPTF